MHTPRHYETYTPEMMAELLELLAKKAPEHDLELVPPPEGEEPNCVILVSPSGLQYSAWPNKDMSPDRCAELILGDAVYCFSRYPVRPCP